LDEPIILPYNYIYAGDTLTIKVDFRRFFQSNRADGEYIRQYDPSLSLCMRYTSRH